MTYIAYTQYSFLSNDELIQTLEHKLGKSPILDELISRLDVVQADEFCSTEAEKSKKKLRARLTNLAEDLKTLYTTNIGCVADLVFNHTCPVCLAQTTTPDFPDFKGLDSIDTEIYEDDDE